LRPNAEIDRGDGYGSICEPAAGDR